MAGFRIDIGDICEKPVRIIGIYTQNIQPDVDHYGVKPNWDLWGYRQAWFIDTTATDNSFTSGISANQSYTLYIGAKSDPEHSTGNEGVPLPSVAAIQVFEEPEHPRPVKTIDNYYDFDGAYAYSVAVL